VIVFEFIFNYYCLLYSLNILYFRLIIIFRDAKDNLSSIRSDGLLHVTPHYLPVRLFLSCPFDFAYSFGSSLPSSICCSSNPVLQNVGKRCADHRANTHAWRLLHSSNAGHQRLDQSPQAIPLLLHSVGNWLYCLEVAQSPMIDV
jgi:hypothetical protein